MSKENDTNYLGPGLSSVLSSWGKSELETLTRQFRGSLMGVAVFFSVVLLLPAICLAHDDHVIVRDRSGNVVATKDRFGDETIVRDRSGNVIGTEEYDRGGNKIIRDSAGNVIGTEDRD
jgi:hypothetical protein